MPITVVGVGNAAGESAGTTTTASTVSVTPTRHASSASGDRIVVLQGANNTSASTPANWTAVFKDTVVGSGAAGAGTGQRYLSYYYRDYDGSWSMPAFTLTSAAQNTQTLACITLRKDAADTWITPTVSSTATYFGTAGTAFTATTSSFTTMGCNAGAPSQFSILLAGSVFNDNVTMTSGAVTGTNGFTSGTVTERVDGGSATGNDVSLKLHTAWPTTRGQPAGTLTHTGTLSAASQGGVIFVQQTASPPKVDTLTDNFDSGLSAAWSTTGGSVTNESGAVRVSHGVGPDFQRFYSNAYYNLTGVAAYVEIKDFGNQALTWHHVDLALESNDDDRLITQVINNKVKVYSAVHGSYTQVGSDITLNMTNHRWLRIREAAGTIYWDAAPDGSTWSNLQFLATPFPVIAMLARVECSVEDTEATSSSGLFDNFNTAPSGASGTVAAALQKATASLTGTQTHTGTVAASLQKATSSLTGAQTQQGTVAASLQQATASLTGAQTQTGNIAASLQRATASLTGTQTQQGTLAAALLATSASMTGVMEPSGTLAAALQKAVFASTGLQTQTGTVAAVLQAATMASTGTQTQTGTVASSVQKASMSAAGSLQPTGIVAGGLQPAVASLAGSQTQTGTLGSSIPALTASISGNVPYTGTIAGLLQKELFSASGSQLQTGSIAAALQPLTFVGSGTQTQTGTLSAVTQRPTASLSGQMEPFGTISAGLQRASMAAAGEQLQTGIIAALLQHPSASLTGEQPTSGSLAAGLQHAVAALTGAVSGAPAAMFGSIQPVQASLTGAMQPSGQMSALLKLAAFTALGSQSQTGTLAAALRLLSMSATGDMAPSGTISAAVGAAVFTALAEQSQFGVMAAALQQVEAELLGGSDLDGALAASLSALAMSATGTGADSEAVMSGSLQPLVFAALLSAYILGTARQTAVLVPDRTTHVSIQPLEVAVEDDDRITVVTVESRASNVVHQNRTTTVKRGG